MVDQIVFNIVDFWLRMSLQDHICSSVLAEITGHYKNIVDDTSSAWRKFVPNQYKMTPSNCWYAPNLNFKILPITKSEIFQRQFF